MRSLGTLGTLETLGTLGILRSLAILGILFRLVRRACRHLGRTGLCRCRPAGFRSRRLPCRGACRVQLLCGRHAVLAAVESARDAGLEELFQLVEDALRGFAIPVHKRGGPEEELEGADLLRHPVWRERTGVKLVLDRAGLVAPGLKPLRVQGAVGLDGKEAGKQLPRLGKGGAFALRLGPHGAEQLVRAGAEGGGRAAEQIRAGLVELLVLLPVAVKAAGRTAGQLLVGQKACRELVVQELERVGAVEQGGFELLHHFGEGVLDAGCLRCHGVASRLGVQECVPARVPAGGKGKPCLQA